MRPGKVSESILKRSVLKKVSPMWDKNSGPSLGKDASLVQIEEGEICISSDVVTLSDYRCAERLVNLVANNLYASFANPIGLTVNMLLPDKSTEETIKTIMDDLTCACSNLDMKIIAGHTEVTNAVIRPVLSASGIGCIKAWNTIDRRIKPEDQIVLTKFIGLDGTALLAHERYDELGEYLPKYLINDAIGFGEYISCKDEAIIAMDYNASAMHDLSHGGIFGGLWEMAEANHVGLDIDAKAIAIRQETVEICERLGLNPYRIRSMGSMLIATSRGEELVRALRSSHIEANIIGHATDSNDRIIRNGQECRYLETPQEDDIYQIIGGRK